MLEEKKQHPLIIHGYTIDWQEQPSLSYAFLEAKKRKFQIGPSNL
jgi:hypothetical protein